MLVVILNRRLAYWPMARAQSAVEDTPNRRGKRTSRFSVIGRKHKAPTATPQTDHLLERDCFCPPSAGR